MKRRIKKMPSLVEVENHCNDMIPGVLASINKLPVKFRATYKKALASFINDQPYDRYNLYLIFEHDVKSFSRQLGM